MSHDVAEGGITGFFGFLAAILLNILEQPESLFKALVVGICSALGGMIMKFIWRTIWKLILRFKHKKNEN